ncbi:MAG: hypothetical protein U1G05_05235 [Kiritimatiellia bacterium]
MPSVANSRTMSAGVAPMAWRSPISVTRPATDAAIMLPSTGTTQQQAEPRHAVRRPGDRLLQPPRSPGERVEP